MPTHARLDLAHWLQELPLSKLRVPGRELDVSEVNGPRDIVIIEQLRAQIDISLRGKPVPTDVCIWSMGEPLNPAATKIGGTPYRPTSAPWPTAKDGSPMALLAQFNFTDSLDVLAPIPPDALPGDILLVFTIGPDLYLDCDPQKEDTWTLEWHRIVPNYAHSPAPRVHDLTPTFATLHRTMDYPDSQVDDNLNIIMATKFGGIPPYIQDDPDLPGVSLCTLASINPCVKHWPLLNVPVNPKGECYLGPNLLMLGDVGAAYFNLDRKGQVHLSADCG